MDATQTLFEGAPFRARILRVWEIDGAYPAISTVQEPSVQQRARIAEFTIDARDYPQSRVLPVKTHSSQVLLVLVSAGEGQFQKAGRNQALKKGDIILIGDGRQATLSWASGAKSISLGFRRVYFQAAASSVLGTPRRLARTNLTFSAAEDSHGMKQAISKLVDLAGDGGPHYGTKAAVENLYDSFLRTIVARHLQSQVLPVARSVKCAIDHIHANDGRNTTLENLASAGGVTQATLIKGFKACLGLSIKDYLTNFRLDAVHASLMSGKDSRPLEEIAHSVGIAHASSLSRLYQQKFGESPSRTRANSVRR
jgi:AraC-like DNA-binding protein